VRGAVLSSATQCRRNGDLVAVGWFVSRTRGSCGDGSVGGGGLVGTSSGRWLRSCPRFVASSVSTSRNPGTRARSTLPETQGTLRRLADSSTRMMCPTAWSMSDHCWDAGLILEVTPFRDAARTRPRHPRCLVIGNLPADRSDCFMMDALMFLSVGQSGCGKAPLTTQTDGEFELDHSPASRLLWRMLDSILGPSSYVAAVGHGGSRGGPSCASSDLIDIGTSECLLDDSIPHRWKMSEDGLVLAARRVILCWPMVSHRGLWTE
jgi:hypothetical protein